MTNNIKRDKENEIFSIINANNAKINDWIGKEKEF